MMAKDNVTGKVSNPEGGFYKSSEEIRAESGGNLTRSEIINAFGEELGRKLLDGGYSSLSAVASATDKELLAVAGIGPAGLSKILDVGSVEASEEDEGGLEEETPDEPEVEEAVVEEVESDESVEEAETDEPVVEEAPVEEVSEEVLPEEPPESVEPEPEPVPAPAPPAPVEDVPYGTEGGMSVKVRRNKERAAREEEERKRLAAITDSHAKPEAVPFELGSVSVDFVPDPDPAPEVIDE